MNRIVVLAATAALIASSASAQSIRVSTEGKTAPQVRAEVFQAARKLCQTEVPGYAYRIDEARACLDRTVQATLAQSHDPSVRVASR
jgi:predicted transglutaminase-like cysteine proteinase